MTKLQRKEILVITLCIMHCLFLHTCAETPDVKQNRSEICSSAIPGCIAVASEAADECQDKCGCDGIYKFDSIKDECVLNYEYLKERTETKNLMDEEKIRENTDKVFRGIIWSALFIVICASICLISVCLFCCRVHYSDNKLKNEVKALATKLKVDYRRKGSSKKNMRNPKEESCNVIVQDANVMCV